MGADSAESGHSRDDGDSALSEVVADDAFNDVGNDGDDEDEEVMAENAEVVAAVNAADENAAAVTPVRPRPQSLPAFVGGRVGMPAPPWRSPTSLSSNISCRGGGRGEKRRKILLIANGGLSQRPWTGWRNQLKAGGGGSLSNIMISMLSMQMQQQTQQFLMLQQMFQQQMQIEMVAMEKRAETSEKYLRRIAKTIGRKTRKRGSDADEDDSSDDDEWVIKKQT